MRIRTIKPEFWESENLGNISRDARLLFIGLFSSCDDHGRTRASSRILASRLFPYDEDAFKLLPKWLEELKQKKCVKVYVVEGETYLCIPNWLKHQKIDRPTDSKLPAPEEADELPREDSREVANNCAGLGSGNGNREQGTGGESSPELALADTLKVPTAIDTPAFRTAWSEWEAYRREARLPKLKPRSVDQQLAKLAEWGEPAAIDSIRDSIRQQWQGLFEPKGKPKSTTPDFTRHPDFS